MYKDGENGEEHVARDMIGLIFKILVLTRVYAMLYILYCYLYVPLFIRRVSLFNKTKKN